MVLDLNNPTTGAIHIASEIHKINYNSVEAPLWNDWLDRGFFNGFSQRVTYSTPANDLRDIIKSNPIVPFKDNFMGLYTAY